jgi:hypothetical protein
MARRREPAPRPARRLIVLGASNVARSVSTAVATAQLSWGGPVEALMALGHGRSYGRATTWLGRVLPGIGQCGLWSALERPAECPATAVITDIGNDLLYGADPEMIAGWVDECLERLSATAPEILLSGLPLANVAGLSQRRYLTYRALFFPRCQLSLAELSRRAAALQDRLRASAARRGARWLEPSAAWYGRDPIHWRSGSWGEIWEKFFGVFPAAQVSRARRASAVRWLYLRSLVPHERRLWGVMQRRAQPAGALRDGTTIAFY